MTGVKRGIAAASLKACSTHWMDTAIQRVASALPAFGGGDCVLHRETGQKPFLNLMNSGADPSASHANSVAAFGTASRWSASGWQVAGGESIYNSVAPAALGHWRMRFNRPVDAQAGEPPPQRAKAARWGPRGLCHIFSCAGEGACGPRF
jgi:hypothetical protein